MGMDTDMDHSTPHSPNGIGHETSDAGPSLIVKSLAMLAVGTGLVLLLVVGIFRFLEKTSKPPEPVVTTIQQGQLPPEPRVEIEPWQQLKGIRAREDHVLNSYAWVDQNQGVVRVPIDRAMDMLAEKGLPSHDYLQDILAGKKQGSKNAAK
jgi:hypothetical protein